ncbi:hypothetical protein [Brumimicrobium aurantiacum]|uniref:Uncharacterized protein n=1 Tax=Brumimicrobium aurantiacum TaxID=1737063 RepID=A0A3E1EZ10_9FLAO|nr:hypothetical protein [Brumimicrobium aurantiacum]RFC54801.1 hypothetical protein DXU93_07400 [Brumimicrobium aurantiacum]
MEEIQKVIAEIETKVAKMRSSLKNANAEKADLVLEIKLLNEKLSQRDVEIKDFKEKYDDLKRQQIDQITKEQESRKSKEVQVDALVREIDDCISRLKA